MVEQYEKTHGIFLERQNSEGCTALYLAVRVGNVDIVKELAHMMTQEGLELKSFSGSSALHQAVGYERIDIVQVLVPLMRKEGLEIKDDDGDTPLNYAVLKGNADIVKALVQSMRQEGLEIRNSKAEIALPRAISKGHMHIVRELLPLMRPEAFEEIDGRGCTALCWAIACLKDREVYEIAKYMAERNDKVFGIPSAPYDEIPVVQALRWRKWHGDWLALSILSLHLNSSTNLTAVHLFAIVLILAHRLVRLTILVTILTDCPLHLIHFYFLRSSMGLASPLPKLRHGCI